MKSVIERMKEENTEYKIAVFRQKQSLPYEAKVAHAEIRAREFYHELDGMCCVSVGGLDSITLLLFLRSLGIDVPAVSVSSLEDKSIQKIHKELGVIELKPLKSKVEVNREFGYPVISKETAGKISHIQHPTPKNATVRHAIITGETGEYGGFRSGTRMRLAQKWLDLFGGPENENEGTHYQTAPFLVSDRCCYYLKEKPCSDYQKQTGRAPYLGLMASEGGRRQKALMMHSHIKDKPFVSTGYYHNGKWWWYSCVCEDYLAEYGCSECDSVDNGIEITHWLPLPEPPKEDPKVSAENAQLRQERDAAVRDLAYSGSCVVCKHNKYPCEREDNGHVRCFEWRGPDGRGED